MCVTNTTSRRTQPISLSAGAAAAQATQSTNLGHSLKQHFFNAFPVPQHVAQPAAPQDVASFLSSMPSSFVVPAPAVAPLPEKPRPKRRRKPQKPGKTAKMNDRHFVVHNYHDHADDSDTIEEPVDSNQRRKGGVSVPFPVKLHAVLDQVQADGLGHVISWQPHGRCFVIHKPKEFVDYVMPKYFRQSKLTSFQRQLNLYGFSRLTRGPDATGYYHELFLRGRVFLCKKMIRTKVKGTKFKAASSPDQEPDFYQMPPVVVSPNVTSDEDMSHDSHPSHSTTASYQYQPPVPPPLSVPMHAAASSASFPSAFEPLPVDFAVAAAASMPAFQPPVAAAAPVRSDNMFDSVLDEAVDELFMNSGPLQDPLDDFVNDWDPTNSFAQTLENDAALGFMLEKLLEE